MQYHINKIASALDINADFFDPQWDDAQLAQINNFRPGASSHRPATRLKMLHDTEGIYGKFFVQDQYVRAVSEGFNGRVWEDSCVEVFIGPLNGKGYFNFEMSCGGNVLSYHIRDWTRTADGFADYTPLKDDDFKLIKISHSLPRRIEPEIAEPVDWQLGFFIPFVIFEKYLKCSLDDISGTVWHGNFQKCGDKTSMPHWGSWAPIKVDDFHSPQFFGDIIFE